jgi:cytochrome c oxidase cbb3-type subunit 4
MSTGAQAWWGHLSGIIILLMMAVFIGIWIWAWRPRHQTNFGRLARLPLDDLNDALAHPHADETNHPATGARHE